MLYLLETAKRQLLAPGAAILPSAATVWAVGVELAARIPSSIGAAVEAAALDVYWWARLGAVVAAGAGGGGGGRERWDSSQVKLARKTSCDTFAAPCRWQEGCEAINFEQHPARPLTAPVKVFDFDFQQPAGSQIPSSEQLSLQVERAGRLNGVVFWHDLHLGPGRLVTSAPAEYAAASTARPPATPGDAAAQPGATRKSAEQQGSSSTSVRGSSRAQALQCLDTWVHVSAGQEIIMAAERDGPTIRFTLLPQQVRRCASTQDACAAAHVCRRMPTVGLPCPAGLAAAVPPARPQSTLARCRGWDCKPRGLAGQALQGAAGQPAAARAQRHVPLNLAGPLHSAGECAAECTCFPRLAACLHVLPTAAGMLPAPCPQSAPAHRCQAAVIA